MSENVQFEEDNRQYGTSSSRGITSNSALNSARNESRMVQWLIKKGIVKSGTGANGVLIVVVIVNIVIIYAIYSYFL